MIISSFSVLGLGVSPGRFRTNFEPNKEYKKDICFKTEGIKTLKLGVEGETGKFITLEDTDLVAEEEWICTTYTLKMPEKFDTPGLHKGDVYAVETTSQGTGVIIAVVKIVHQVWIDSPYPGKYLEITGFNVKNTPQGSNVPISISAQSKGEETINSVYGIIKIYDYENNLVDEVRTNTLSDIKTNEIINLNAVWISKDDVLVGNYDAKLQVFYDSDSANKSTSFKIGGIDANLIDYSKELTVGGIKEFYVDTESLWSENLNIKAEVKVYNSTEKKVEVTSFETITKAIPAWGKERLNGYIDTDALKPNNYTIDIILKFDDLSKSYTKSLEINADTTIVKGGLALSTTQIILIVLTLLLIVMIVIILMLLLPLKKYKKDNQ